MLIYLSDDTFLHKRGPAYHLLLHVCRTAQRKQLPWRIPAVSISTSIIGRKCKEKEKKKKGVTDHRSAGGECLQGATDVQEECQHLSTLLYMVTCTKRPAAKVSSRKAQEGYA